MANPTNTVFFVNAFTTDHPLSGNPAAVCILEKWIHDDSLQAIAAQHNLSETAFAVRTSSEHNSSQQNASADYEIRWFTPIVEVELCGHATLATAQVLFSHYEQDATQLTFASASGSLIVHRNNNLTLDFPQRILPEVDTTLYTDRLNIPIIEAFSNGNIALLVCENETHVAQFVPDFSALAGLAEGISYITAQGNTCDFVCRVFAPRKGIPEDPVTGSAYTCLAPYWANRLGDKPMHARQLSTRGGHIEVQLHHDRVMISGRAEIIIQGEWLLGLGEI